MPYKRVYHTLKCPECGSEYQVLTPAYIRKTIGKSSMLCNSCRGKKQIQINVPPEKREELRKTAKARYDALSDEQKIAGKAARTAGTRKMWANLSSEERDQISNKRSEDRRKQIASWTEERRDEVRNNISKAKKRAFDKMDRDSQEEWKQKMAEGHQRYWDLLSDDEKSDIISRLVQGNKRMWESMSDEERSARTKRMSDNMKVYWKNMSEEKYTELLTNMSNGMKQYWDNLSRDERQVVIDRLKHECKEYWMDPQHHVQQSEKSKEYWQLKTIEERYQLLLPLFEGRNAYWDSMTDEEREQVISHLSEISKSHWANLSPEEYDKYIKKLSEAGKKRVANMTSDEFQQLVAPLEGSFSKWYQELSKEEKDKYADRMRGLILSYWENDDNRLKQSEMAKERWAKYTDSEIDQINKSRKEGIERYWNSMTSEEKYDTIRSQLIKSLGNNKFHQRFERQFKESMLSHSYNLKPEQVMESNGVVHSWDYGIYDMSNSLVAVVDLDGMYFHADSCDYDGLHSKEEYDEKRSLSIPVDSNVKIIIILENRFKETFEKMIQAIMADYDSYIQNMFNELRLISFPYPNYTPKELLKSFDQLQRMNVSDKYHKDISLNTRIGDHLIQYFHHSIWHAHTEGNISPYQAWYDDELLMKVIRNRVIYQNHLNPNKILQGFNISKIAPKVSVFSAGRAKMIISRYLSEYNTIFDPFSGFSGRMLGTVSLGKRYIGQDISEIHVRESNEMIKFLQEYATKLDVTVSQQDILSSTGSYQCLFTCPPYGDKEQWQDVPIDRRTCDEWIDICLDHFKCKKYVFVVDETTKYKEYIVNEIRNKSHFSNNSEKIIVINR